MYLPSVHLVSLPLLLNHSIPLDSNKLAKHTSFLIFAKITYAGEYKLQYEIEPYHTYFASSALCELQVCVRREKWN